MSTVMNRSGNMVDALNPDPAMIDVEDIAHGLAYTCRWRGQCNRFYSVAEHSVHLARLVNPLAKASALMHDAAEAYLTDMPSPIKAVMPEYRALEDRMEAAICAALQIDPASRYSAIKDYDRRMLITEAIELGLHPQLWGWEWPWPYKPLAITLECWPPEEAKRQFLVHWHTYKTLSV